MKRNVSSRAGLIENNRRSPSGLGGAKKERITRGPKTEDDRRHPRVVSTARQMR